MPISTPWTIDQYRAMRRDPAAHPDRVASYGMGVGGLSAGNAVRRGSFPEGFLQPFLDDLTAHLLLSDALDPDIERCAADWRELFTVWISRTEVERRLGRAAITAFDAKADEIHALLSQLLPAAHRLDLDGHPFSWWFDAFDLGMAALANPDHSTRRLDESGQPDLAAERVRAFTGVVLLNDSRSPVYQVNTLRLTPEQRGAHVQARVHVAWLDPMAARVARHHRRLTLEYLLGRTGADPGRDVRM